MSKTEALRRADALDSEFITGRIANQTGREAAIELRRLSAQVEALEAENSRLTTCLTKANEQAEHFEREWYLRGDKIEALEADAARYQWLRSNWFTMGASYPDGTIKFTTGSSRWSKATEADLDAAIDAAIAKEQT